MAANKIAKTQGAGTSNRAGQQALEDALKKKQAQGGQVSKKAQTSANALMGGKAAAVRGLSIPTLQTGNVAKSNLATKTQMLQDLENSSGNIDTQEKADWYNQQVTEIEDAYKSGGANTDRKLGDIKQQAFYSPQGDSGFTAEYDEAGNYLGSKQNDVTLRHSYTGNERRTPLIGATMNTTESKVKMSKDDKGKYVVMKDKAGNLKKVPVNTEFRDYVSEKHPGLAQKEAEYTKLMELRTKEQNAANSGTQITLTPEEEALRQKYDSGGYDPMGNALTKMEQEIQDYKEKQNVSGGYLDWQMEQGKNVAPEIGSSSTSNAGLNNQEMGVDFEAAQYFGQENPETTNPTANTETTANNTTRTAGSASSTTNTTTSSGGVTENTTISSGATGTAGGTTMDETTGAFTNPMAASSGQMNPFSGGSTPNGSLIAASTGQQMNSLSQYYGEAGNLAGSVYAASEEARAKQLRMILNQTNAVDAGINLGSMSVQELESLLTNSGLDISQSRKDAIQAGGKSAIENELMAKNEQLAYVDINKRGLEREFNRALTEREEFNVLQDRRSRALMAARGVSGKSGASVVGYMKEVEKGQRAREDLLATYADKSNVVALQAQNIVRTSANNIMAIENQMASAIEAEYQKVIAKGDELINMGVTNKKDLAKAMGEANKEYLDQYLKITQKYTDQIIDENKTMFDQQMQLKEFGLNYDKYLSASFGFLYQDGQQIIDAETGLAVPTLENMKFVHEQDRDLSVETGFVHRNGAPARSTDGNLIPTFSRSSWEKEMQFKAAEVSGYYTDENGNTYRTMAGQRLDQDAYQWDKDFQQSAEQFKQTYGVSVGKLALDVFNAGLEQGSIDVNTGMIKIGNDFYNPQGAKYKAFSNGDEVRVGIPEGENGLLKLWDKTREQCGEFVNDVIGKKIMPDSFAGKMKNVTSVVPIIGSAFVQALSGDMAKYGHTGIVEKVDYNDAGVPIRMEVVDSNSRGDGKARREVVNISYDNGQPVYTRNGKKIQIEGFTDSVLGKMDGSQQAPQGFTIPGMGTFFPGAGKQDEYKSKAQEMLDPYSSLTLESLTLGEKSKVQMEGTALKKELLSKLSTNPENLLLASGLNPKPPVAELNTLQSTLSVGGQMQVLNDTLKNIDTGPILGIIRSNNPWDDKAKELQAKIVAAIPGVARGLYGEKGVLTDQDFQNYIKTIPNINSTEGAKRLIMEATQDYIDRKVIDTLEFQAKKSNVKEFTQEYLQAKQRQAERKKAALNSKVSQPKQGAGVGNYAGALGTSLINPVGGTAWMLKNIGQDIGNLFGGGKQNDTYLSDSDLDTLLSE